MPMRQVKTEAGTLTYELCRKRVKNLNLRVRADGSIAVSAPAGVTVAAVDEFVRRKAGWIAQVEQKLADRRLPDPEYGALLGHRVPLVVEPGPPGVWPRQGALLKIRGNKSFRSILTQNPAPIHQDRGGVLLGAGLVKSVLDTRAEGLSGLFR